MNESFILESIMKKFASEDLPIIFKGAMILKLAIKDNNPQNINRITKDIDGDWCDIKTTMQEMTTILNNAIRKLDENLMIIPTRNYTPTNSAGFDVITTDTNDKIASIDLSVRNHQFKHIYACNGVNITGASIPKMITDKVCVVSSKKIYRRAKDLLDLYILSHIAEFDSTLIYYIAKDSFKTIGDFKEYLDDKSDLLKHAYNKLTAIENKPDFHEIKERLDVFLAPFIIAEKTKKYHWAKNGWTPPVNINELSSNRRK